MNVARCIGVLGCLLGMGACATDPSRGYSFVPTHGADARTVSVGIFDNYTHDKGAEIELTEAVVKEIQRATSLRVTTEAADTTITGLVRSSQMYVVARDTFTGLADEVAVKLVVDFEWKDNRSGRVLVGRRNFAATDTFVPGHGTNEPIEAGRRAAAQRLARDLVAELRSAW